MKMPLEMEKRKKRDEIVAYAVRHLPIIKEFALKLGIVEVINELVPSQMDEDPGTVFLGMILDTLSGRTPLYRLDEFFESQDTELLLGKDAKPEAFKDYSVARVLDKAYEVGSIKIFTEISRRAVILFDIDTSHVSFDTTSISVYGEYEGCSGEASDAPFAIACGYSKNHRPDLKQFLVSLLCVDKNIPIIGKNEDGNASDKTVNNTVLSSISKHLAKFGIAEGAYIYIADSAMVTEENLKRTGDSILFVSRLPATYNECARVIKDAVEKDLWEDVGVLAETKPTKNRPAAHYKAHESEVELHGKKYRALVVHSSAHDKRRKKKIDRELEADRKAVESKLEKLSKQTFFCFKDAEKAMKELLAEKSKYHSVEANVEETKKYKRGRPANGERKVDRILFSVVGRVEEKPKAVENFKKEAGCFVLLTNVPKEGKMARSSLELLKAYKDQHGIEQNFGFLKDPVIVNSIFLKKPERIEVLGLVLLLSLLIWRLLERAMRNYAEKTGEDLPGWKNRRTTKPTSFMLGTKFAGVIVLIIGGERRLSKPLTSQQKEYLHSLGIRSDVFTNPKLE
jgi:transposase